MFSLRIVNVDHYMSSPKSGLDLTYSQFRGAQVKRVPVFRIFGSTSSGNKTCLHIHGVFPYILVPYSGEDDAGRLMYQLASSLDKAINVSQNTSHSSRQHVFKIVQVSGRPFYGYHSQDHQFFKIFFYNPMVVKRACDLLQNGAVCGTKFQIHEGHVPFTLQFFIDYNLYGMSFINLKSVVYRQDASPPGVTPGTLQKESCCELEADAVAVDILNRLTIEGELAVNPGLAAIWREEKQRLKREALDVSQRPEPPLAMSEVLLREKLRENLKYQGKCKTPLKEKIPYPAETQKTTGSDILDASVLDTHLISSLANSMPNPAEETTIIDEELVLNLTQSSLLSNSLDQSLMIALDNLAAQNEMNAAVTQDVEDDSILGSQMLPEPDVFGHDISDGELEVLNYSLPPDLGPENLSDDEIGESDESGFTNIPQLDGVGDFGSKKKSKQNKRRRRVLVENAATETYQMSDGEEIVMSTGTIKDNECWPEPGKQETLEEIFSDEEPYNSPMNNFEDSCVSVDVGTINLDVINPFETVLRGDPSFVSGDLASEDVMFQPLENVEDEKKSDQNLDDKKRVVDKNSNVDSVPSLNISLDSTDMLAINGDELLDTSQLDKILNEDLNKGLEIICEKSPQREFEQVKPEESLNLYKADDDISKEQILETLVEYLHSVAVEDLEDSSVGEVIDNVQTDEDNLETQPALCDIEISEIYFTPLGNDIFEDDQPQSDAKPCEMNYKDCLPESPKKKTECCPSPKEVGVTSSIHESPKKKTECSTSPKKVGVTSSIHDSPKKKTECSPSKKKLGVTSSIQRSPRKKLFVKWTNKKRYTSVCNIPSFEMSRSEIEKYYSQLEAVANYFKSLKSDSETLHPILWFPLRETPDIENLRGQTHTNSKAKTSKTTGRKSRLSNDKQFKKKLKSNGKSNVTSIDTMIRKCKFSHKEMLKIMSCKVTLKKLTKSEINLFLKKPKSSKIKTEPQSNIVKKHNSKRKSLHNTSELNNLISDTVVNLTKQGHIQETAVRPKQDKSLKTMDSAQKSAKTNICKKLQDKELLVKETPVKSKITVVKKSDCSKKSSSKELSKGPALELKNVEGVSDKLSEMHSFRESIRNNLKKLNLSANAQGDEVSMKEVKVKQRPFVNNKKSKSGKEKDKPSNCTDTLAKLHKASSVTCGEVKDLATPKDQSTSFKLDKECMIKLLPVSVDKAGERHTDKFSPTNVSNRTPFTDSMSLTHRLDTETSSKELNEENNSLALVRHKKLDTLSSGDESVTLDKEKIRDTDSGIYSLPLKLLEKSSVGSRKRPVRIYSLDGTADNSSSDENLEDKERNRELPVNQGLYSTPNKRRKSKSCRSPRNYVPLNIEIKKSPKVKPKKTANEVIEPAFQERLSAEGRTEDDHSHVQGSSLDEQATFKCHEKRKLSELSVSIERLPLTTNLEKNDSTDKSHPSTSTSSLHPVKKLKVFVKRLSLDTPGDSLEHGRVAQLRGRFHRSASLPTTSEEKTSSSKTIIDHKPKCHSKGGSVETCSEGVEVNVPFADKETKVRKALRFPGKEEQSHDDPSPSKIKQITKRKISIDIFDANSAPESPPVLSNHSENSSDFLRLSGVTRSNTPNFDGDTLIPQSPLSNTILSLNLTECGPENMSFIDIDRNPHGLQNPTLFTPALFPPTRSEVLAKLREYGLPEVVTEQPFYSDPADVPKACEVGSTLLKLQSKSVVHMEEFEGSFGSLSKWKRAVMNKIGINRYQSLPKSSTLTITPLKTPPTRVQVKEWLKSKLVKKNLEVAEVKKITKIVLPSSPGNSAYDDDDMLDNSMTISQCTPLSKTSVVESDTSHVQSQTTPEVVSRASNISPLMASTPVNNQLKLSTSKIFSRPSSGFRQSLPLIREDHNLESGTRLHQEINTQTASGSDSTKLLSDSGIQRLLSESKNPASTSCQIDMVTPNNSGNYRLDLENLQDVKLVQEHQFLTILSMELHVHTRGELRPNPDHDAICCVFYNITNDCPDTSISNITGAIYVSSDGKDVKMPQFQCDLQAVADEPSLIAAFVTLVKKWDPDIFVGYEIELLSWGYLLQRAYILNLNLVAELSRVSRPLEGRAEGETREMSDDDSEIRLTGRIVLNLWRFLRHEVALQSYTFENMMYHALHQRVPLFSFCSLTSWWAHRTRLYRWLVFEHYITRVEGIAKLMRHVDLVGRTSEFARLFGIQFYEVLSRGSQFRVESMMLRLVKPLNYVAVSPSVQQRAKMRAPESLPLIMEPQSRFYTDPVIVLDFQSLYPSIIIAYNYCYSTCLGRVEHLGRSELFEFGCTQLRVPVAELMRLKGSLNFSPCGVTFVNQSVVRGVLPRMLQEILNTRLMVKQSMKENKENKTLQRVLHNRQLGLKLIANVTYGYTAANFSGRMPCIELGDSVVSKARETLERAISLVSNNQQWGARVIYGDTDSMFVLVPGRSRQEAFRIGAEIAEAVTNDNPQPVKLKLEKVYQPCLLQTKKRYVGYMYESPGQEELVYDAKGIETVRRDGCPAVAKVLEKTLRLLFETKDMSLVKRYICRQFTKVLSGRISVQDLTFAREYRGAAGYKPGACVPALELAKQGRAVDPRSEPRVGQRVPYVVVAGAPGLPLIRLVRPPSALLQDPGLRVNAEYYITRVIAPPLHRCLSLLGAHVAAWYSELPRKQQLCLPSVEGPHVGGRKATISQYFATCACVVCGRVTSRGVCDQCQLRPQQLSVTLASQVLHWERRLALVTKICQSCCGRKYETDCISLDCPVLYRLYQARKDLTQEDYVRSLQQEFLSF